MDAPLQALIIDSWFDNYLGVVSLVRVMQGTLTSKSKIVAKTIGKPHVVDSVGVFTPKRKETGDYRLVKLALWSPGLKIFLGAPVGDTITNLSTSEVEPLPGFQRVKPQVYAGMFPVDSDDFEDFREALANWR